MSDRTGPLQVNPDCRDGKHAGGAWDLDNDLPATCKCGCHQPPAPVVMGTLAGGGRYLLGPVLEGSPVKWGDRVVGHVANGKVVITDPDAILVLNDHRPLEVSVAPDPAAALMEYGRATVDSIRRAATESVPDRRERRKQERRDRKP